MKVTTCPSVERLSAISDFDEKLVTIWSFVGGTPFWVLFGTSSELTAPAWARGSARPRVRVGVGFVDGGDVASNRSGNSVRAVAWLL
jgi:hypothetical protein